MIDYSVSGLQQKMVFELLDRSRRSINALDGVDASCANSESHKVRPPRDVPPCSIDGCTKKHLAKGFCHNHYYQAARAAGLVWAKGDGSDRRRAMRHGVAYEPVDRREVYARDGYVCGVCLERVNPELQFPHPLSASLDHVIPVSKGGPHLYWNVQTAHLWCNLMKGAD